MTEQFFLTSATCLALACAAFGFIVQVARRLLLSHPDRRRARFAGGVSALALVVCHDGLWGRHDHDRPHQPRELVSGGHLARFRDGAPRRTARHNRHDDVDVPACAKYGRRLVHHDDHGGASMAGDSVGHDDNRTLCAGDAGSAHQHSRVVSIAARLRGRHREHRYRLPGPD